jgi:hypothetical protein
MSSLTAGWCSIGGALFIGFLIQVLCQLRPVKATGIFSGQIMGLKIASCQLRVFFGQISIVALEQQQTDISPTGLN